MARKSIYNQFTTTTTIDEIRNANASKVSWTAESECERLPLMQRKHHTKGAPALHGWY